MMDEPKFAQPIPNVTGKLRTYRQQNVFTNTLFLVAVGRDANLPCVVEHLGSYKVIVSL